MVTIHTTTRALEPVLIEGKNPSEVARSIRDALNLRELIDKHELDISVKDTSVNVFNETETGVILTISAKDGEEGVSPLFAHWVNRNTTWILSKILEVKLNSDKHRTIQDELKGLIDIQISQVLEALGI